MLVNNTKLEEVFARVSEGKMSVREAANELGIARSSFHRAFTHWVEQKIEERRRALLKIEEEVAATQGELKKLKEELVQYEPLKRDVEALKELRDKLRGEIREALELKEQRDKLKAEVENLQRRRNTLTAQVSELNRRYEELLWLLKGWESYRIWLQSEIERLSYEVNRLKGEKEDLQSSILALTAYKGRLT
jgi:chromosome segregation ATPase